jgi:hypothetical protein
MTDVWSDLDLMGYLVMTAHFIIHNTLDGELIMRSGLLAFSHIHGSHTSENITNVLFEIVKDAGIEQRVC